jgi:uncharacterized RDD family membrane protein YckC
VTTAPSILRLPAGVELSAPSRRLAAFVLDLGLASATLGIGWAVWSLIVWRHGQTPAKQLLGMTVVVETTRKVAGWWCMLWRELVVKSAVGAIPSLLVFTTAPRSYWWVALPLTIALYCWLLWDPFRQQLWDKLAGTLVVDDPYHQLDRGPGLPKPQAVDPLEELSPAAEQVVRAAEYLRQDMPDVALKLLRSAAEDARRRRDAEALHGLLRLMARVRARIPAQLAWQADLIAEIAQRGLEEARSASPMS